jgi:tRNA G10  N-methylase Trm11
MKNTFSELQSYRVKAAVESLKFRFEQSDFPNNKQLLEICAENGVDLVDSAAGAHLIHEILETALNLFLTEAEWLNPLNIRNKENILARLEEITKKLPPQSWRDNEQIKFQQFSTPPALAFVLANLLRLKAGGTSLEPSAGTGSLAVWLKKSGCKLAVNEISGRRRALLEVQNYQPLAVNAEFIDDLLPAEVKPDYILMNPPFSAGNSIQRDSNYGFRHVEAALRRLNPGGRLVALLGAKSCLQTDKGKKFWYRLGQEYSVHALLTVPPEVYYKYGTNFQTVAVIISKPEIVGESNKFNPQIIEFKSLGEMMHYADALDCADF